MDLSPLAILERAELAARERRLAAGAEADDILAAAEERVAAIEAETPDRVAAAIVDVRRRHEERAEAEVQAIGRELADLPASPARVDGETAFAAAVELVVAAVLGEPASGAAAHSAPGSAPDPSAAGGGT
jgi:hypothetical protein